MYGRNVLSEGEEMSSNRPLAIVTGASSGIGKALARICAEHGFDLVVAADEPSINDVASTLERLGVSVHPVQADLATIAGVDRLHAAAGGRPIDALLANAGHGLGKAFLDQEFTQVQHVINTNITGTIDLIQRVARSMRERGRGKILITGSIAGFMPGTFQAVYNGSKAFLDSFSYALRNELKDTGVTVTCLMPGATDTAFFKRTDLLDTKVGADERKADPADVARTGFNAMEKGEAGVVAGLSNKLRVALAGLVPETMLAEQHRKMAEPGSAHH
jgi:short-subunit dehydrogenase